MRRAQHDFGRTIRAARTRRGVRLQPLSRRIGCAKGYLSAIETGHVSPPRDRLVRRLAVALGLDANDLLRMAYVEKAPRLLVPLLRRIRAGSRKRAGTSLSSLCPGHHPVRLPGIRPSDSFAVPVARTIDAAVAQDRIDRGDQVLVSRTIPARDGDLVLAVADWRGGRRRVIGLLSLQPGGVISVSGASRRSPQLTCKARDVVSLHRVIGCIRYFGRAPMRR